MKRLTPKIMLAVCIVYLVAASPFILGVTAPSIHEGRYAAVFTLLNFPVLLVVSRPLKWVEEMFPQMTSRTSDLLALSGCLMFWLALALVIGLLLDRYRRKSLLDISHEGA
jgi:hypothetical protein